MNAARRRRGRRAYRCEPLAINQSVKESFVCVNQTWYVNSACVLESLTQKQGVPALFRWLSKKYPKIVQSVEEEEPEQMPGPNGEPVDIPVDISRPNPNGEEYDCLYLDMNGIVHPCTHPEGKPPPETEEDMMAEVFKYTERVINMIRPRKLLMMAIDGVAPRAKMNQQRSRRFRSAQDAKILHQQREQELEERKRKGLAGENERIEKSWDSNAITPGTPFMDLLASSLRYWIAHKLNTDPGWKNLCVVLSDASVPGEGEHKIMDYIRRKRSDPNHDPNMRHVIYGLDADLIMLSLATHEPHFKVLREDVFSQDAKHRGCHRCGQEGHVAANCRGEARNEAKPFQKKPFIFLDVPTLREYLQVELRTPGTSFPFDLERAIDDWVFLIFFVGNDFLPHLPSLEIREGAIDTLLRIWKRELPNMSGYVTNNGKVELANAQYILDGLAEVEDDIFRKRKETEERQEANKRRHASSNHQEAQHGDTTYVQVSKSAPPQRPVVPPPVGPSKQVPGARNKGGPVMLDGNSIDVVKNRAQIRMANISAAEQMRMELAQKRGAKRAVTQTDLQCKRSKVDPESSGDSTMFKLDEDVKESVTPVLKREENLVSVMDSDKASPSKYDDKALNGKTSGLVKSEPNVSHIKAEPPEPDTSQDDMKDEKKEAKKECYSKNEGDGQTEDLKTQGDNAGESDNDENEDEDEDEEEEEHDEDEDQSKAKMLQRKVRPDGTVEYEDTVKLWEPGYRERYYRQKFGVELSDTKFRRSVVQAYVEGLCWVLAYYYQGCPSWKWFYPYHYAPFAADFTDVQDMHIDFGESEPFRPFEQLMGVLPAASKSNLPVPFQQLMTNEESEIIDFYPNEFSIDMNGKKMAWQGVALLPFIDENRLLHALHKRYAQLTDDEVRRNSFGRNVLFVSEDADLFPVMSRLYTKRSDGRADVIDTARHAQIAGTIAPDTSCVPGSTFYSPLPSVSGMQDIQNDRSIWTYYDFPPQFTPHRSVLLHGVRLPSRRLTPADADFVLRGSRGGGRGSGVGSGGASGSFRGSRGRRGGWSDQGVMYGRDARPSNMQQGPYGAGPYARGPYGGGPYGGGVLGYGGGPYGGGPNSGNPYVARPYGGASAYGGSPYGGASYAVPPYSGGSTYGAPVAYGQPYPTYGNPYQIYGPSIPQGISYGGAYGHAGTAYGSAYGQNSHGYNARSAHAYQGYGAPRGRQGPYGSL